MPPEKQGDRPRRALVIWMFVAAVVAIVILTVFALKLAPTSNGNTLHQTLPTQQ